ERPAVAEALKRAQRLFRVSTSPEAFGWLMENDYSSALQIAELPLEGFLARAEPVLGKPQTLMMHNRATGIADLTLATLVQLNDAMFGVFPEAVVAGEDRIELSKEVSEVVAQHFP